MTTLKRCSKCKEEKSIDEFHKKKSEKDGVQYQCKCCMNAYQREFYKKNQEKIRKRQNERPISTEVREQRITYLKNYRKENSQEIRERERKKERINIINLSNNYLKKLLKTKYANEELIDLKRIQIQLHREIRKQNG